MGGNAEENANHAETFPLKEKYLPQFFFPPQNMNNPKSLSNMFCDKHHVNQLTSLLHQHQICACVVCPGSRNAILIHNFKQAGFQLYPVTDERSAAFVALGICLQRQSPVAICVTSGSALLNTLPAVAEASYRHLPLLVISADRPTEWIGQLDGQTLPQEGALTPYTETFHLSAAEDATANWHNQLLINRALLRVRQNGGQPVHINIPIREPLFSFQTAELPVTWPIREEMGDTGHPLSDERSMPYNRPDFLSSLSANMKKGQFLHFAQLRKTTPCWFFPKSYPDKPEVGEQPGWNNYFHTWISGPTSSSTSAEIW